MFPAHQHPFRAAKLLLGALIFLQACSWALSSMGETCYSRQHRDTIVKALDNQKTVMEVRKKEAERDCILACCSEELKPGIKCNMVVYKPSGQDSIENCYLFHCETEQDCPLMSAKPGTNTYDIFKGMTHPSTKGKERVPTMPITITKQPSTTQSTSTTMKPTTTTQPTTTPSTMSSSTTTRPTTTTTSTIAPTELAIILLTMPVEIVPTTTSTTTTTQSTSTTAKVPSTTGTTTTTHPVEPPQPPPNPIRPLKKPIRPPKKLDPHGKSNPKLSVFPTLQKQATPTTTNASTTTSATTSTTPTTTTPTTTTTTTPTTYNHNYYSHYNHNYYSNYNHNHNYYSHNYYSHNNHNY
ncbi:MANSC domain-containing protein 1 [Tachysurus ichikawai]